MRNDKLIPGLVLVLIGAAILLANFGYLHFHWYNIFHLWPIFLVIAGVNLVFAHSKAIWATIIKVAVVVLGLGLVLFGNFGDRYNFWPGMAYHYGHYDNDDNDNDNDSKSDFNFDDDDDDDNDSTSTTTKVSGNGTFNEPYKAGIKYARVEISGGATTYNLSDTTNQLFSANAYNKNGRYDFSHSTDDSVYVVSFKMKDHNGINFDSDKNKADFRLNLNPIWDVHVKTGASKLDFDLSKFKIRNLKLDGGAASFDIKLGAPLTKTNVDISTGVSGVDINIPQNAACSIETDSGLSGNHFDGFTKTGDNDYETPGFAAAKNKMYIHITGGLSDFKVHRY
ncbi:hypothetical protein JN11_04711 [Mucilaginibacter frigoritolerans]|uniref:LiaI-LiaF-like transmembrane region domain-containing protein n=1 Tax=Mucilaginibacter frigoritolerans TaxID=652788 RepID=A0A562TP41_9SPHI|nr:DUF5668 domain-containing protein [Mucilaginibacter frigoritolerans]TWI94600.1 hypothetical protein JN11_04711 [Mucilaginibacter frigoritolerans]